MTAGVAHLVRPRVFDAIVPPWLPPSRRFWTLVSGLAEIGTGCAVAGSRTRRAGGIAAAALFVGVFPGNLWMAWRWRHRPWPQRAVAYARLPLQAPLVAWAVRVHRAASPRR